MIAVMLCPIKPMLAKTYKPDISSHLFPGLAQPKLDGYRCLSSQHPNHPAYLWSRNQKTFNVPHIAHAVAELLFDLSSNFSEGHGIILDGELYLHGQSFGDVQSLITREGHPEQKKLSYHIYDCYLPENPDCDLGDRQQLLENIIKDWRYQTKSNHLIHTPNHVVRSKKQYDAAHSLYTDQGYEGSILRPLGTLYEQRRSSNLLKRKDFLEDDFYISEINRGQGKNYNAAIFTCISKTKEEFTVTAHGNYQEKLVPLINPKLYLGKFLTIKYQELTEDGIPRFPVALGLKNDRRPGKKP